jgi:peptidoglycan-N-acetylglucosamine deacetylase
MKRARSLARTCLAGVDRLYRRWHRLRPVGPLMLVGRTRYRGPARRFADGATLEPGDPLGTLHFDNTRLAALGTGSATGTGLQFARQLFRSMRSLGELVTQDEDFRDIAVFRGIGWIRHGGDLGFLHEPLPPGPRQRFLARYLRLLVWAFAAEERTAERTRPEPTVTWLTRDVLLTNFTREGRHG